jgi:2-amino-4-hydroxy-6-hydroxymethyldihydropteridine diphosphokinase
VTVGFLGLGSNVGDRRTHLTDAVALLPAHDVSVCASSSVYETEPVGLVLAQPDFFNVCLRVVTELGPEELLTACKTVEREAGRTAGGVRHGPRVIDVDILTLGDLRYQSSRLTLPHPEMLRRRFVLVPLIELDESLTLPGATATLREALASLAPGQGVRLAGPPLPVADHDG